jgi:hypothetical protein
MVRSRLWSSVSTHPQHLKDHSLLTDTYPDEPDKTRSINHLSFVKGQRLKILRRPESGDYFIAEVTVRGKVYVGSTCLIKPGCGTRLTECPVVPAHMIEPIDDQATTSHQPRRIDDQSE